VKVGVFFRLSSLELATLVIGAALAATGIGYLVGRSLRRRTADLHEPVGVVQTALLGFVGLILAFGLALAVGRYETRRASVVEEANAIGTTYLRAQTLAEPMRSRSLELLTDYTDASIRLASAVPTSAAATQALEDGQRLQRELWALAGRSLATAPIASAPRLYVETLNHMIDQQAVRKAALNNRVPPAVLWFELASAMLALGLLAFYLALLDRSVWTVLVAAALVSCLLLITFDLDRPVRGFVRVPDTPLVNLRASMELPPAARAPRSVP
jgi:hypothetical protein